MAKKKTYSLHFVKVGDEQQTDAIIKNIAKNTIQGVLEKHGVVSYNLDDVVTKYISEEMCNGKGEEEK